MKLLDCGEEKPPANLHFSLIRTEFEHIDEERVRVLSRNKDVSAEMQMKPQDKLLYGFLTYNPTTGFAGEYHWASGRVDVYAEPDIPYAAASAEEIRKRADWIDHLERKYHDRGFKHYEYDGGIENFARNYEQSKGYPPAPEVVEICRQELRAAA